jgi:hypothetical protein
MNGASSSQAVRKRNLRLGLILASVALTFFVGFILKMTMLAHH